MAQVSEPVSCAKGCGITWARDPALEVECPDCHAGVGHRCKRPSEHNLPGRGVHASRDLLADRLGHYGICPLGTCGKHPPALAIDLTDVGLQYVIPGCEKDPERGPAQLSLLF